MEGGKWLELELELGPAGSERPCGEEPSESEEKGRHTRTQGQKHRPGGPSESLEPRWHGRKWEATTNRKMASAVAFQVPQARKGLLLCYTHSFIHQILPEYSGAGDTKLSCTSRCPRPSWGEELVRKEWPNTFCWKINDTLQIHMFFLQKNHAPILCVITFYHKVGFHVYVLTA